MSKKIISIIFILLCCTLAVRAQGTMDREYEYQDELEEFGGPGIGIFSVSSEAGKALGSTAEAGILALRFTHYFSGHFGAYAMFGAEGASVGAADYFGALNKLEGGKYRYRYNRGTYDMGFGPLFTLGGVYRLDFGSCGFRARAGLGYGRMIKDSYTYERLSRADDGTSGSTYYSFEPKEKGSQSDYLAGSSYYSEYNAPAIVFSASAQFIYKMGRFYLMAEAGLSGSPSRATVERTVTGTVPAYNPSNYVEAVAYDGYRYAWVKDDSSVKVSTIQQGAGVTLHAAFGIGLCLGRSNKLQNR